MAQLLLKEPKLGEWTILDTSLPAPWRKFRDILPVSWMAAQKAVDAFGYSKHHSIEASMTALKHGMTGM